MEHTFQRLIRRLKAYKEEGLKVADLYPQSIVKHVNANQPLEAVVHDIMAFLKEKQDT